MDQGAALTGGPLGLGARRRVHRLVLAIVLTRVVLVLAVYARGGTLIIEDAEFYVGASRSLVTQGDMGASYYHQPGYPLLLAPCVALSGVTGWPLDLVAGLLHALGFGVLAALTYSLAWWLTASEAIALISAGVLALLPDGVPYSVALMPETFHTMTVVGGTLMLVRANPWCAVGGGLVMGLAALFKPISTLHAPPLILALSLMTGASRGRYAAGALCGFLVPVLGMCTVNLVAHGRFSFSRQSGLYTYDFVRKTALEDAGEDVQEILARESRGLPPDPWERSRAKHSIAVADMLHRPWVYVASCARRHWRIYVGTGTKALLRMLGANIAPTPSEVSWWRGTSRPGAAAAVQLVAWAIQGLAYACAAWGLLRLWRTQRWLSVAVLGVAPVAFLLATLNFPHTRYRFPWDPHLAILAAIGLGALLERVGSSGLLIGSSRFTPSYPLGRVA